MVYVFVENVQGVGFSRFSACGVLIGDSVEVL